MYAPGRYKFERRVRKTWEDAEKSGQVAYIRKIIKTHDLAMIFASIIPLILEMRDEKQTATALYSGKSRPGSGKTQFLSLGVICS